MRPYSAEDNLGGSDVPPGNEVLADIPLWTGSKWIAQSHLNCTALGFSEWDLTPLAIPAAKRKPFK